MARLSGVTVESVFNSKILINQFHDINGPLGVLVSMGKGQVKEMCFETLFFVLQIWLCAILQIEEPN